MVWTLNTVTSPRSGVKAGLHWIWSLLSLSTRHPPCPCRAGPSNCRFIHLSWAGVTHIDAGAFRLSMQENPVVVVSFPFFSLCFFFLFGDHHVASLCDFKPIDRGQNWVFTVCSMKDKLPKKTYWRKALLLFCVKHVDYDRPNFCALKPKYANQSTFTFLFQPLPTFLT